MSLSKNLKGATSVVAAALLALYLVPTAAFAEGTADAATPDTPATQKASPVATVTAPDGAKTSFDSLAAAVAAAAKGSTITLESDLDLAAGAAGTAPAALDLKTGVTLDGAGHTLTVHGRGVYLYGGDDEAHSAAFVLKNITITNPDAYGRTVSTREGYKSLRLEDATLATTGSGNTQVLTIGANTPQTTDIAIVASTLKASQAGYGIITFNPVDLTIADSQVSGYAALYMKGPDASTGSSGSKVTITDGSVLTGKGIAGPWNSFGTVVLQQCDDVTIDVSHSTINAEAAPDSSDNPAYQSAVLFSTYGLENDTAAKGNTVTISKGSTVNATGENSALTSIIGRDNQVKATDGTYHLEGAVVNLGTTAAKPAESLVVTGGNWNKDVAPFAPAGYTEQRTGGDGDAPFTVGKATPEQPDQPTNPDQPANPDQPTNPDTPTNPGTTDQPTTPGTTDGNQPAAGDDQQAGDGDDTDTDADGAGHNPLADHEGGVNDQQHRTQVNGTTGTTTHSTTPTRYGTTTSHTVKPSRTASVPQTGDPLVQTIATVGGVALFAALVIGSLLLRRQRSAK